MLHKGIFFTKMLRDLMSRYSVLMTLNCLSHVNTKLRQFFQVNRSSEYDLRFVKHNENFELILMT
jgi:hypothetical protein